MADYSSPEPLRVLMLHNFYQTPGGEDQVFLAEKKLLESRGHTVITYTAHNDIIRAMGKPSLLRSTFWSRDAYRHVRNLIRRQRPRVLHAHNTFPLISPSVYTAARSEGVPVVQTLHNFRLLCANGLLLRKGVVCERCVGRAIPWPAVTGRCYRASAAESAVAAGMMWYHRTRGTWTEDVDVYVALTAFARDKFIAGGLPGDRIVVKPNFVEDPWDDQLPRRGGDHALFVGRLSSEKGVATILAAWRASATLPALQIIGDGPMRDQVMAAAASDSRIGWRGAQSPEQVRLAMGQATVLLVPSLCYEGAPRVIAEAFAVGLPIVGSAHGAPGSQITPWITGLLHRPGDAVDLAEQVNLCFANGEALAAMREGARQEYLASYTAATNYQMLLAVYARAMGGAAARGRDYLLRPAAQSA